MKGKATSFVSMLFLILILFCPEQALQGACKGILLWFRQVLPALLPFFITSGMLVCSGAAEYLSRLTSPILCPLFRVSPPACYVILTGFLCGYPMGSRTAADLVKEKKISEQEGGYLLSFCNNTSPAFIINYIALQNLHSETLILPFLLMLLGGPVLCSFLFRRFYQKDNYQSTQQNSLPACSSASAGTILEDCIYSGIENIVKIGAYMMLFSILISIIQALPADFYLLHYLLLPSLEMTTGITMICNSSLSLNLQYLMVVFLTSFGGWCCIAQTSSMIHGSGLKTVPYIVQKLITALVTSFFAFLYFYLIL